MKAPAGRTLKRKERPRVWWDDPVDLRDPAITSRPGVAERIAANARRVVITATEWGPLLHDDGSPVMIGGAEVFATPPAHLFLDDEHADERRPAIWAGAREAMRRMDSRRRHDFTLRDLCDIGWMYVYESGDDVYANGEAICRGILDEIGTRYRGDEIPVTPAPALPEVSPEDRVARALELSLFFNPDELSSRALRDDSKTRKKAPKKAQFKDFPSRACLLALDARAAFYHAGLTEAELRRVWFSVEGYSAAEIARAEGVRRQTVHSSIRTGLSKMVEFLGGPDWHRLA